jgi:hypothetical protein
MAQAAKAAVESALTLMITSGLGGDARSSCMVASVGTPSGDVGSAHAAPCRFQIGPIAPNLCRCAPPEAPHFAMLLTLFAVMVQRPGGALACFKKYKRRVVLRTLRGDVEAHALAFLGVGGLAAGGRRCGRVGRTIH